MKVVAHLLYSHQAQDTKHAAMTSTTNVLLTEPDACTLLRPGTHSRLSTLLTQYSKLVPGNVMQAAVSALPPQQQQCLSI